MQQSVASKTLYLFVLEDKRGIFPGIRHLPSVCHHNLSRTAEGSRLTVALVTSSTSLDKSSSILLTPICPLYINDSYLGPFPEHVILPSPKLCHQTQQADLLESRPCQRFKQRITGENVHVCMSAYIHMMFPSLNSP